MKVEIYDEVKEDECPDNTPPAEIEQILGDINDDNNEDNDEGKEAEFQDDTYHEEMEEDVSDKKNDKNAKNYEEKNECLDETSTEEME